MTATINSVIDGEPTVEVTPERLSKLRRFNLIAGVIHLISGVAMIVLGNDFSLDVSSFALNGPPGTPLEDGTLSQVVAIPLAWGTASFLLLSAIFHFLIAGPGYSKYGSELRHGRNRFRWVEYSLSATLMIVLIALVTGVTDLAALIAIAVVNMAMILFGWVMEMVNDRSGDGAWWTPFWFGCVAGVGPWAAIGAYLAVNATRDGGASPPGFVWGIIVSLFVLFNCFAVNQWLQYRRLGKWRDYLVGESTYIVLSLVAKSLLAWQVFVNTLV